MNAPFSCPNSVLDEVFRNRGEVDRDERRVGASRLAVDQTGEELLPCAAFAKDQHIHRGRGDPRALPMIWRVAWLVPTTNSRSLVSATSSRSRTTSRRRS